MRWLNDNGRCLCAGCHWRFTNDGNGWERWLQQRLGLPRYFEIQERAYKRAHYSEADLLEILEIMKAGGDHPWKEPEHVVEPVNMESADGNPERGESL